MRPRHNLVSEVPSIDPMPIPGTPPELRQYTSAARRGVKDSGGG
ncbi:MAG: hypothetical protein AAFX76_06265 [Planctomycetota bacterium]